MWGGGELDFYVLFVINPSNFWKFFKETEKEGSETESENINTSTMKDMDEGSMDLLNFLKVSSANFDKKSNRLTLATLLEVLDGVMEMDGRMLIITTNYPEKLDKALIRPGRIDLKLKFEKCTKENLVEMYTHYFENELPDGFDIEKVPDHRWTPAEATQVFLNHMYEPEKGLDFIVNGFPQSLIQD